MPSARAAAALQDDAVALDVKCPTCGRERERACITLRASPDGRIRWMSTEPHPLRVERSHG